MTKQEIQTFTARISQSNRSELVVISYDIITTYIKHAREALSANPGEFVRNIKLAKEVLEELKNALDFNYPEIAGSLMSLYLFLEKQLNACIFKKQDINLDTVLSIIDKLRVGFEKVAAEDVSGAVMSNTETIYAGITYGKGTLEEMYEGKTGFRA